jgi:hypothetical protein
LDERRQRAPGLSESALRLQVCQRRNACCSCQHLRDARWLHAAWLLPEACKLIVVALACVFGNRHETCQGYQRRNACCSCHRLLDASWLLQLGYCLELANSLSLPCLSVPEFHHRCLLHWPASLWCTLASCCFAMAVHETCNSVRPATGERTWGEIGSLVVLTPILCIVRAVR